MPYLFIPSRISLIDEFIGGFKAKTLTYLYGNGLYLNHVPYDLCLQTYITFGGISIFIDGGTSMNPYILSQYAKTYELSPWNVLRCVQVSRAFTLHQFHSIVHNELEPQIKKHNPQTLIVHEFPLLYLDKDVSSHEAKTLFVSTLNTIKYLTNKYHLITLITNSLRQRHHNAGMLHHSLLDACNELICVQQMKHCPRIWLPQHHAATTLTQGSEGQLCLQDFGMVL